MKKFDVKNIVFLVLAILWMGVIFAYSSMEGPETQAKSYAIDKFFAPFLDDEMSAEQQEYVDLIDVFVRKTAHAIEYALLSIFVLGAVSVEESIRKNRRSWVLGFIVTVFYAFTDEIHQLFVPGRIGRMSDVIIDSFGALIGMAIFAIIFYIFARRNKKNSLPVENE